MRTEKSQQKPKIVCRFCGQQVATPSPIGHKLYKARTYAHKCPHGKKCRASEMTHDNWAAQRISGGWIGCPECLYEQKRHYNETHGREIFKLNKSQYI